MTRTLNLKDEGALGGGRTHTWRILSPLPLPLGYEGVLLSTYYLIAWANLPAFSKTISSISRVSLPVNVFCWLGWKLAMSKYSTPSWRYRNSAPWVNLTRPTGWPSSSKILNRTFHPNAPRPTNARTVGITNSSSRLNHGAHLSRSSISGALPGGAHLTADVIHVCLSFCPSLTETLVGIFAIPIRCSEP